MLGDLAQGTTPWAARNWVDQFAHLGKPEAEVVALTTGYRVPAADEAIAGLTETLTAGGIETVRPDGDDEWRVRRCRRGDAGRVAVVPASLAKGLEYDHVIAVEPAAIVGAEPRGLNRLYVVLTRAVSRLDVLHHRPPPAELS